MTDRTPENPRTVELIRQETLGEHARSEAAVEERFFDDERIAPGCFRALLRQLFGLYRGLEARLIPALEQSSSSLLELYGPRTERLEDDLRTLGASTDELGTIPVAPVSSLPALDSTPALFGCLYVIEGSELGNLVLRRRMENCLDSDSLRADAFFHADHEAVVQRWKRFQERFDREISRGGPLGRAVRSAKQTFGLFREWLS